MIDRPSDRKRELWPMAIAIVLILFVLSVIAVALFSTTQRRDLVKRDYYGAGLEHQERVEASARALQGGAPYALTLLASPRGARIAFAERFLETPIHGTIELYRPSNAGFDRRFPLALDHEGHQIIEMTGLPPGYWKLKVRWELDSLAYFHEEGFVLP